MIDLIYRWLYRRERRERPERMAAFAEVMRQRQADNDARWDQVTAEIERARQLPPDEFLAWAERFSTRTKSSVTSLAKEYIRRMEDT